MHGGLPHPKRRQTTPATHPGNKPLACSLAANSSAHLAFLATMRPLTRGLWLGLSLRGRESVIVPADGPATAIRNGRLASRVGVRVLIGVTDRG
jgi:hypothetical protein